MPTHAPLNSEAARAVTASHNAGSRNIRDLISLSVRGLVPMFDDKRQVFCNRLLRTERGIVSEDLSPRYTIMTLLGLREVELAGMDPHFDTRAIYASFVRDTSWIQGLGDLGLLIWLHSAFAPDRLDAFFSTFDRATALDRFPDSREGRTMELSWFLTGLAFAAETSPKLRSLLTDLSLATYRRIKENQGGHGFFGHLSTKSSLSGRLRGRVGSFADQVYPIFAMSWFARVFASEESLRFALSCAHAICSAQGSLGQWWWLYDSGSGRVSSHFPVYAVHQHGMAPMALFAAEGASGQSFDEFIYKGVRWLYGANELGVSMIDDSDILIWRCILPKSGLHKYREMVLSRVAPSKPDVPAAALKILYEQRPYEYGWLLYAFAGKAKLEPLAKG